MISAALSYEENMRWFDEARFGLFIHWGIYSLLGRGEQILFRERQTPSDYRKLADRFKPTKYDPDDWMRRANQAGMKYAVLTTKHHDGYCLFDSKVSDFTSTKTAARRDMVAEYVEACRRHNLKVGLYYSLADWGWPEYFRGPQKDPDGWNRFIEYTHAQVRELCSNYGKVDVLWFDAGWPWTAADWRSEKLDDIVRSLQPHVMINDRLHGGGGGNVAPSGDYSKRTHGYYSTAEQRPAHAPEDRPVETERTSHSRWWGYTKGDRLWKSSRETIHHLVCAAQAGANFLYNVGPKPDGTFPAQFNRILADVGSWMRDNRDSIHGTKAGVVDCDSFGAMTVKGNRVYLHVLFWPGREFALYGLANNVRSARFLASGQAIDFEQNGHHVHLRGLPSRAPDPYNTVIVLDVDGVPCKDPAIISLWEGGRDTSPLAEWAVL